MTRPKLEPEGRRATEGRVRALRVRADQDSKTLSAAILARLYDKNTTALDCMGSVSTSNGVKSLLAAGSILERSQQQPDWRKDQTPVEEDAIPFLVYWVEPEKQVALLRIALRPGKRVETSPKAEADLRVTAQQKGSVMFKVFGAVLAQQKRFRALCMGPQSVYNAMIGLAKLHDTGRMHNYVIQGSFEDGTDAEGKPIKYIALELVPISDYKLLPVHLA
jgi:hypothetical protein